MEFTRQFTRREKILLVIMSIILLVGAYFWLVQQPLSAQRLEIASAQAEADAEITVLQTKLQLIDKMHTELEQIKSTGNAVETPSYDNLQAVIAMLNSIMAETSDYSLSFQTVKMPEKGNIVRRVIDMRFTCTNYAQARNVIARLHSGAFRCQISGLSVSAVKPSDSPDGYVATLNRNAVEISLTITYFESKET